MYRNEHPKPNFVREKWLNLNGKWKYYIDKFAFYADETHVSSDEEFTEYINVPFCPESSLSGVEHKDFIKAIWYKRDFEINSLKEEKLFLHFGAVDYETLVYVNGRLVGKHYGGGVSFSFDITEYVCEGINKLAVCAVDGTKPGQQRGKQCDLYNRYGCLYTRVTGIWQTVWLEWRPKSYIKSVKTLCDFDNGVCFFTPVFENIAYGDIFTVTVNGNGKVFKKTVKAQQGIPIYLEMADFVPWSPENPFLYHVEYELKTQNSADKVVSYLGMRKISVENGKFYLNNKEIFLRFVLDQGYYPQGIWTAPSDYDLKNDIILAQKAGFNGARLHQKVFEERYLYHADVLGYLVWAENYDWGIGWDDYYNMQNFENEWIEEIERDRNHPCIIAWTPFNETSAVLSAEGNRAKHDKFLRHIYDVTHFADPTRPVNDTSGYIHVKTDIYTVHDYDQNPETLKERYKDLEYGKSFEHESYNPICPYEGQPFVVDEYGGPLWAPDRKEKDTWGYSENKDIEEVYTKIESLTRALADNKNLAGFCYTQLTDVEQEKNGIYTYDRKEKFDIKRINIIFNKK